MNTSEYSVTCKVLLRIGVIGFTIALVVNLIALYVYAKPSAEFFSQNWWAEWFPGYAVSISFLAIAVTQKCLRSNAARVNVP